MQEQEDKTNYLMRCFRHTCNKDRENYVVLGIWHRLSLAGLPGALQPITQQLVRRHDGRYALIDLYFPAIKLAIECDEAYHQGNCILDRKREDDIFQAFAECGIGDAKKHIVTVSDDQALDAEMIDVKNLVLARVDASRSYQEIDRQLDDIVAKIKARYVEAGSPTWDCRPADVITRENGFVDLNGGLIFTTVPDILRGVGIRKSDGTEYRGIWRGEYRVRDAENISLWFPHLSYKAGGWSNISLERGNAIEESRGLGHSNEEEKIWRTARKDWRKIGAAFRAGNTIARVVFAHSKNALGESGYRFMGVYQLAKVDYAGDEDAPTRLFWQRVSTCVSCGESLLSSVRSACRRS